MFDWNNHSDIVSKKTLKKRWNLFKVMQFIVLHFIDYVKFKVHLEMSLTVLDLLLPWPTSWAVYLTLSRTEPLLSSALESFSWNLDFRFSCSARCFSFWAETTFSTFSRCFLALVATTFGERDDLASFLLSSSWALLSFSCSSSCFFCTAFSSFSEFLWAMSTTFLRP